MKKQLLAIACAAAFAAGGSNAAPIAQVFSANTGDGCPALCGTNGGTLTFEEISDNLLVIRIDNTTDGSTDLDPGSGVYFNSSVITGFVFNVFQDITSAQVESFTNGSGAAITGWTIGLNVNNETTPGSTVFDVAFETTNGINGGIYNAASPGSDIANVVPDIATLTIRINDPVNWVLENVGDSILHMQRVGLGGAGSPKIPTSTGSPPSSSNGDGVDRRVSLQDVLDPVVERDSAVPTQEVPEPSAFALLLASMVVGVGLLARARRRKTQG